MLESDDHHEDALFGAGAVYRPHRIVESTVAGLKMKGSAA